MRSNRTRLWVVLTSIAMTMGTVLPLYGALPHEGIIMRANNGQLGLREMPSGIEMTFEVAPTAIITRNGNPTKLDELKPGDHAMVQTETDGRKMVAMMIVAKSAPGPGSANSYEIGFE